MKLRLFLLISALTIFFQGQIQAQTQGQLVTGLRTRLVPVLENGQIRVVKFLEMARTDREMVKEQFSRRQMNLAKPLKSGARAQTDLPNWPSS
ncbi:uncharacterized protein LOC117584713 [Drosophila guanche]|uniref:uncharacterized protein LOC117584713 n=1 Tax=Drosophila guanche TaxID=7266 RepID=UPI0014712799|nr:uncharacterized protein LOC117584713 [Drosophila guanche]